MKLRDMSKEEIELLSYTDITYRLLQENKKSMNTSSIFHEICNLLGYSDSEYSEKIGDFYTSLTIDKRFVMLDNAEWDLRENHAIELNLDEEDEDSDQEDEENLETEEEIEDEEDIIEDENIDEVDDDIDDLSIVADEELDEEE